jgi:hypothetical protein
MQNVAPSAVSVCLWKYFSIWGFQPASGSKPGRGELCEVAGAKSREPVNENRSAEMRLFMTRVLLSLCD